MIGIGIMTEAPPDDRILHELEGGILRITINRPEVKNALGPDERLQIVDLLNDASSDLSTRAIVLHGAGGAFCSGADLRGSRPAPARPDGAPEIAQGDIGRGIRVYAQNLIGAVMDCEKPVIAAVSGVAAGLGAHLAFACDLIVAASDARFIEVFVRRGLVPDAGGAYLLPRMIGPHRAKQLLFFGDDVSADDARDLGIVNTVVPAAQLMSTALAWAARLAAGPTRALALSKALVNRSLDVDRATAFEMEAWAQDMNMTTHDGNEGVNSFKERRPTAFKGW
jgi:2-(1,2-epoxy-1,2-dihydrophenyl)acetyl-CoA isomerase